MTKEEYEADRTNFAQECTRCGATFEGYTRDASYIISLGACSQCIKQALKLQQLMKESIDFFEREENKDLPEIDEIIYTTIKQFVEDSDK